MFVAMIKKHSPAEAKIQIVHTIRTKWYLVLNMFGNPCIDIDSVHSRKISFTFQIKFLLNFRYEY
ncbi:hypothetical protein BpHYR1_045174 [Brachionus plicatilis]|uniref:Uncharacterized protein n=1 Tax=Brachionus plicatilis TaxID=10195 RepID=A0A3M7P3Q0_BRAPC|nr:hypothetical protein BpHYR1_045174 [Brachionus plicatilis]